MFLQSPYDRHVLCLTLGTQTPVIRDADSAPLLGSIKQSQSSTDKPPRRADAVSICSAVGSTTFNLSA